MIIIQYVQLGTFKELVWIQEITLTYIAHGLAKIQLLKVNQKIFMM